MTASPTRLQLIVALLLGAACARDADKCEERFHVDSALFSSGVDDGTIASVASTNAEIRFGMTGVDEDGEDFRGDAQFPLVGDDHGTELHVGFRVELNHSGGDDGPGALRPVILDGNEVVFAAGDPYEAGAEDHAEPAFEIMQDALDGPCHEATIGEGHFAGLRFNDEDKTVLASGESKTATYGSAKFIIAAPWAFVGNDGAFSGWGYAWRVP